MDVPPRSALVIVDVQNGFCDDFAPAELPVTGGGALASRIATAVEEQKHVFAAIVATKDYHVDPGDHFASPERPADYVDVWPVHCVAGTPGAEFHPQIAALDGAGMIDAIFYKGAHAPAYSGFEGTSDPTGDAETLTEWLHEHDITTLFVCGIATSHCVKDTALSGMAEGFEVHLLADLSTGVTEEASQAAIGEMAGAGVVIT